MSDADGDGVDDHTIIGCIPENNGGSGDGNNTDNNSDNTIDLDSDDDGVDDLLDDCPETEPDAAVDAQGCSYEQKKNLTIKNSGEQGSSSGMIFMLSLITIGLIVLLGAGTILLTRKTDENDGGLGSISPEISEVKAWDTPILDGTSPVGDETGIDMSKFPGWSPEQVQNYMDTGWSEEQLAEWYNQQIDDNSA